MRATEPEAPQPPEPDPKQALERIVPTWYPFCPHKDEHGACPYWFGYCRKDPCCDD